MKRPSKITLPPDGGPPEGDEYGLPFWWGFWQGYRVRLRYNGGSGRWAEAFGYVAHVGCLTTGEPQVVYLYVEDEDRVDGKASVLAVPWHAVLAVSPAPVLAPPTAETP